MNLFSKKKYTGFKKRERKRARENIYPVSSFQFIQSLFVLKRLFGQLKSMRESFMFLFQKKYTG